MPLILDPDAYSEATLRALATEFAEALAEMRKTLADPPGRVLDPASIVAAGELIDAALGRMNLGGPRPRAELAANANLGYATMVAVIDLVKSHTDAPRVPARGKRTGTPLLGPSIRPSRSSRAG